MLGKYCIKHPRKKVRKMKNILFTIVAKNYLASARALAKSISISNPDCDFYIVLADKANEKILNIYDENYKLLLAEEIGITRFLEMAYKYDVTEFATAIKPFCIEYFQNRPDTKNVLYIDPDIYVYESLKDIFDILEEYSAVVTPHILTCNNATYDVESSLLFSGTYNLGFFGVSNSSVGKEIVNWWKNKLVDYAYVDYLEGLYTDQKWMNLVTTEFDSVYVLRDFSYNVAWWNFKERNIVEHHGKPYVIQNGLEKAIVFFHFSGFKARRPETISKSSSYNVLPNAIQISNIFSKYEEELISLGYDELSLMPYAFLNYDNGIIITRLQRRLYRAFLAENGDFKEKYANPFSTDEKSFYSLLKQNGLLVKSKSMQIVFLNRNNMQGFEKKEKIIQIGLRLLKYIMGIQRYEMLIRYLSHSLEAEKQLFLLRKGKEVS